MKFQLFIFTFLVYTSMYTQNVGINSTGANGLASAKLDINAIDKGLLIPRVNIIDLTTAAPITLPATSLMVYNTNTTSGVGYYYWDAVKWNRLHDQIVNGEDHDWYKVGTSSYPVAITDNIFTQGKVGIREPMPVAVLDIAGDMAINRTQMGGGTRAWMVDGLRIGAAGSDNAYFGMRDEGVDNADAVIAWGDDIGDHFRFIHTRSGGPLDGSEYMRIEDLGDIGIGVSNPSVKLEVGSYYSGDVSNLKLRNTQGSGSIQTGVAIDFHHFDQVEVNSQILSQQNGLSGHHANLLFLTEEGVASPNGLQERMRIGFNGKVGIGEQVPGAKLDVKGDARIQTIATGNNTNSYLVADANGIIKSAPLVTNITDGGTNLRLYTGNSPADGTGWVVYPADNNGIYIDIDISACGFTTPPMVFTTMGGGSASWTTTGSQSTYQVTATSFRIYLNLTDQNENNVVPTTAYADANNWYIKWFAIGK